MGATIFTFEVEGWKKTSCCKFREVLLNREKKKLYVKHHDVTISVHVGPVKFPTRAHLIVHDEGASGRSLSRMDENSNVCLEWFEEVSDAKSERSSAASR